MTVEADLGRNIKALRDAKGLSQNELSQRCELPRSTLAYLESGEANPALTTLIRVSKGLGVSIEELLKPARLVVQLYSSDQIPVNLKRQGAVEIKKLLPDPIPGMEIDKMKFQPGERMTGTPHLQGTKEYLYCQRGKVRVYVAKQAFELEAGGLLAFPGDLPHAYENPASRSIFEGFSVVVLA